MSHLLKFNLKLKKTFTIFFSSIIFLIILFTVYNYEGNKIILFCYSILINLILINCFKKNVFFFEFFFGILLWLGFWLKLVFIINYYDYKFFEGAGEKFEIIPKAERLSLLDSGLIVSIIAFIGYLSAIILKEWFIKKFKMQFNISDYNNKKIFLKIQNFFIIILFLLILFLAYFNLENLIYQRGLKSQSQYNFLVNGIVKWLLLFGLSSFISTLLFINLKNKKKTIQLSLLSIFETFISNISFLSRGMIFNAFAIFYGIYKSNKIFGLRLNLKYFISYFLVIFIFFFISVSVINYLRHNHFYYHSVESIEVGEKIEIFKKKSATKAIVEKRYDTFSKAVNEFYFLAINRWVGIDAVVTITAKSNKNWKLLIDSFKEEYDPSKLPYYERVMQERTTNINENQLNYGITTPGIVAFLFYSGSKVFLFVSLFFLVVIFLYFEKKLLDNTSNLIFCSLIAQQIAYRLIHFGYMPSNSYMFFGTIIFTIIIHQFLLYLSKKI